MRHLLPKEILQIKPNLDCDRIQIASINWGMDNDPKLLFRMKTLLLCVLFALGVSVSAADKPNILFILADDLGYGDVGCYNAQSKVPTPHLDHRNDTDTEIALKENLEGLQKILK